jgi:NitT/TauT family transport system ATP-binding protein
MPSPAVMIAIKRVGHVFRAKGRRVQALLETDLDIHAHEFLTIVGPSGCGKSTLMNLIVGLFPPSTGEVLYRGKRHTGVNCARTSSFRSSFATFRHASGASVPSD